MNLDRAIQSFSVPLGGLITVSNLGFHAPPNHPGFPNDGTQGNAGFSNAAWTSNQTASALTWSSETFAQNQNANAIRWGTLYNFRFDSNRPPAPTNATIGFFKTGAPVVVAIQGPDATNATPTPVPTASPSPPPVATPTPTPTPSGFRAQPINLSTRMQVGVGINVGIGGFILARSSGVVVRALGPSLAQAGVPNTIPDPILLLQGRAAPFATLENDNWSDPELVELGWRRLMLWNRRFLYIFCPEITRPSFKIRISPRASPWWKSMWSIRKSRPCPAPKCEHAGTCRDRERHCDCRVHPGRLSFNGLPNTGPARIVVRGLGPSLASSGVPNRLGDPTLELRDSNGALLMANNNWQENPAQAAELTAAGLAPTNQLESALAVTLAPGAYTALLAGANNGTGIGVVEVYERRGL